VVCCSGAAGFSGSLIFSCVCGSVVAFVSCFISIFSCVVCFSGAAGVSCSLIFSCVNIGSETDGISGSFSIFS